MSPTGMSAEEFRAIRRELGMSQTDLAERLGYGSQPRISEIEAGKRGVTPRTERLLRALVELRGQERPAR